MLNIVLIFVILTPSNNEGCNEACAEGIRNVVGGIKDSFFNYWSDPTQIFYAEGVNENVSRNTSSMVMAMPIIFIGMVVGMVLGRFVMSRSEARAEWGSRR